MYKEGQLLMLETEEGAPPGFFDIEGNNRYAYHDGRIYKRGALCWELVIPVIIEHPETKGTTPLFVSSHQLTEDDEILRNVDYPTLGCRLIIGLPEQFPEKIIEAILKGELVDGDRINVKLDKSRRGIPLDNGKLFSCYIPEHPDTNFLKTVPDIADAREVLNNWDAFGFESKEEAMTHIIACQGRYMKFVSNYNPFKEQKIKTDRRWTDADMIEFAQGVQHSSMKFNWNDMLEFWDTSRKKQVGKQSK